jgi:hypothetical protein
MSSDVSGKIWALKEEAKWARDTDSQMKAIRELGTLGAIAIPSLEEIQAINTREEIKQCCIDSIKSISYQSSEKTLSMNETNVNESNSNIKKNQQEEKTEIIERKVVG